MDVFWKITSKYQAFTEPSLAGVSLLSSSLADDARGLTLDDILLLVVDGDQQFCDFELTLDQTRQTDVFVPDVTPVKVDTGVRTSVSSDTRIQWFFDRSLRVLQVVFEGAEVERWYGLPGGQLTLGVDAARSLCVIHCRGVIDDPDGSLAAQWLQQACDDRSAERI